MPIVETFHSILAVNDAASRRWNATLDLGTPVVVTYSFPKGRALPDLSDTHFDGTSVETFSRVERERFREATRAFEDVAGLRFAEVDGPAMIDAYSVHGIGTRPGYNNIAGYAHYPSVTDRHTSHGDVVMNIENSDDWAPGRSGFVVLLHELGHAVGLEHTHEGSIRLSDEIDDHDHSVMTYNWGRTGIPDTLQPLDVEALRYLYGDASRSDGWTFEWIAARSELGILGGDGDDAIVVPTGTAIVRGRGGDDVIHGREAADRFSGGSGNDRLFGHDGDDRLIGSDGRDRLFGGSGDDRLSGGDGNDRLAGGDGDDLLRGGGGRDRASGGSGKDTIFGNWGADRLAGSDGEDELFGQPGQDRLYGGHGDDRLHGGLGEDQLFGGSGEDRLRGEAGSDRLSGDAGSDVLVGGKGRDVFVFRDGHDRIEDWRNGERIEIDRSALNWNGMDRGDLRGIADMGADYVDLDFGRNDSLFVHFAGTQDLTLGQVLNDIVFV